MDDKAVIEEYNCNMSVGEIISELPRLTEGERQRVLEKLRELSRHHEDTDLKEPATIYGGVNLRDRGIGEGQARDLRARLQAFAEDWDRPEASIYDEDPAR